jgi:hypothetical protein
MNFSVFSSLVLVDATVDRYENLVCSTRPDTKVIVLNSFQDGVEQITQILAEFSALKSLHLVSHGYPGGLLLGSSQLNGETVDRYRTQLQTWSRAFAGQPEILLYGCEVAAGDEGQAFVQELAAVTGGAIAASSTLTGNAALGGDWNLEYTTAELDASLAFSPEAMADYASVLTGTSTSNSNNLLNNAGFSQGNTGFTSSLPFRGENVYPDDGNAAARGGYTILNSATGFPTLPAEVIARAFPGDPTKGVAASDTFLYSNPNASATNPTTLESAFPNPTVWEQDVTNLAPNTTYSFLVYFDNLLESGNAADPVIDLQVNGTSLGAPVTVLKDSPNGLGGSKGWVPVEYKFTTGANQTTAKLSIVDKANTTFGDDFAFTAVSFREDRPIKIGGGTLPTGTTGNATFSTAENPGGSVNLPIVLDAVPQEDLVFTYSFINGTAQSGSDYNGTGGTITIPKGSPLNTSVNIPFSIVNDTVEEGDETFTIRLAPTDLANRANVRDTVVTIRDDERPSPTPTPTPTPDDTDPTSAPVDPNEPGQGCQGRGRRITGSGRINGTNGRDTLNGRNGRDTINGRNCNDTINGRGGNDRLLGGIGRDVLNGGSGRDRMDGGAGSDRMRGGSQSDRMFGKAGNDTMIGDSGNDTLIGGSGSDLLIGRTGNDRLLGGIGDDIFIGGIGRDRSNGGGGRDTFLYRKITEGGNGERIDKFEVGADVINVKAALTGTAAANRFTQYVRLVASGTGTQVQIDSAGNGQFQNLVLLNGIAPSTLTASNFVV